MWKNVFKGLRVELQVKEDLWITYCSFKRPHNVLTHTQTHSVTMTTGGWSPVSAVTFS